MALYMRCFSCLSLPSNCDYRLEILAPDCQSLSSAISLASRSSLTPHWILGLGLSLFLKPGGPQSQALTSPCHGSETFSFHLLRPHSLLSSPFSPGPGSFNSSPLFSQGLGNLGSQFFRPIHDPRIPAHIESPVRPERRSGQRPQHVSPIHRA